MAADGTVSTGAGGEACKKLELTKFGGFDAFQVKDDVMRPPNNKEVQVRIVTAGVVRDGCFARRSKVRE